MDSKTQDVMSRISQRFWAKVAVRPGACWLWTGYKNSGGYGLFAMQGKREGAHRVSYGLHKGPIPPGLVIDHLCRVRGCVNPAHLEAVTAAENLRRQYRDNAANRNEGMITVRNARKVACNQGHPFTKENTYITPKMERACRQCLRRNQQRWLASKRVAAKAG